jgi:FkbM family methyltransferase
MRTVLLDALGRDALIEVDETDHIGRIIATGHWYEQDLLADARKRVTGPGTAVDVGAHIGNHTLWFALAMGLHVVAIEPNPASYTQLAMNVAANRVDARLIAAAVGRESAWGTSVPARPGNTGMATFAVDGGPVPVFTLDELNLTDVKLLKIDVEGAVPDVLAGAQTLLAEQSPVIYAEADPDALFDLLPAGYRCFGRFAKTPTWGFARG